MLLFPDAVNLAFTDLGEVQKQALMQCQKLMDRFVIMDVKYDKPRFRIRLRSETELFNKSKSSRTIFEDVILLYFEFKNGSKFLVLKKNLVVVDF